MARLANVNTTDIAAAVVFDAYSGRRSSGTRVHSTFSSTWRRAGHRDREAGRQPGQRRNQQLGRHPRGDYHDAERIRARFLVEGAAPDKVEETRRWADSLLGAYGFPAPYGHDPVGNRLGIRFNLDVVGGTADYRERTT